MADFCWDCVQSLDVAAERNGLSVVRRGSGGRCAVRGVRVDRQGGRGGQSLVSQSETSGMPEPEMSWGMFPTWAAIAAAYVWLALAVWVLVAPNNSAPSFVKAVCAGRNAVGGPPRLGRGRGAHGGDHAGESLRSKEGVLMGQSARSVSRPAEEIVARVLREQGRVSLLPYEPIARQIVDALDAEGFLVYEGLTDEQYDESDGHA